MTTYSTIRASDADREQAVAILRDAYAAGRLTLAEFDERTTAALTGRTWGALGELTKDLPNQARLGADLRPASRAASDPPVEARDPGERTWRILPLVPVAAVWLVVALSARMPDSVVPVIIALLLLLRCTVSHRPAERNPPRRSDPPSGSGSFR
jgi:hypothetical protein